MTLRRPYRLYAVYDPGLSNGGDDDTGTSVHGEVIATDDRVAGALITAPSLRRTSSGFKGASDGWTDLAHDHRMDWTYSSAPDGNVVQTGETPLTGLRGGRRLQLALGFGSSGDEASAVAL